MRVNSTQSLILNAPAERLGLPVGAAGALQRRTPPLATEPLDVSWTEIEGFDALASAGGQAARSPAEPSAVGGYLRGGSWGLAQQYEQVTAPDSAAKGTYLDVHA